MNRSSSVGTVILLAAMPVLAASSAEPHLNPTLAAAESNVWVKLHTQAQGDPGRFMRQAHAGSCLDTKRSRIVIFGSDTHDMNWDNSPLVFDIVAATWSRAYPNDDKSTYAVNAEGLPVAGTAGDHPWAMHTFGAVAYDPDRDEVVVCAIDPHCANNVLKERWAKIGRHPTWTYSCAEERWRPLACPATTFFASACVWDADRKVVVGYGDRGLWELGGEPRQWTKIEGKPLCGIHNNAVYDSRHKALVNFGSWGNSNDVIVYRPAGPDRPMEHRKMPTPGLRPPPDQHNPMCFDAGLGKVVVIVDRVPEGAKPDKATSAETWLYDLGSDTWTQVPTATLPFACGMNYNMHYDPRHEACVLVVGQYQHPTTVYGLKLRSGHETHQ